MKVSAGGARLLLLMLVLAVSTGCVHRRRGSMMHPLAGAEVVVVAGPGAPEARALADLPLDMRHHSVDPISAGLEPAEAAARLRAGWLLELAVGTEPAAVLRPVFDDGEPVVLVPRAVGDADELRRALGAVLGRPDPLLSPGQSMEGMASQEEVDTLAAQTLHRRADAVAAGAADLAAAHPLDPAPLVYQGLAAWLTGSAQEAEGPLTGARALAPMSNSELEALALRAFAMGDDPVLAICGAQLVADWPERLRYWILAAEGTRRVDGPEQAAALLERGLAGRQEPTDTAAQLVWADAWFALGVQHEALDRERPALSAYERARAIYEAHGRERSLAEALHNIGVVHANGRSPSLAVGYLREALGIRQRLGLVREVARTRQNLGYALGAADHFGLAGEELARSAEEFRELEAWQPAWRSYLDGATEWGAAGRLRQAGQLLDQADTLLAERGAELAPAAEAELREARAVQWTWMDEGGRAEELLRASLVWFIENEDREGEGRVRYELAAALLNQRRTEEAIVELEVAQAIAEEIGDERSVAIIERQLADLKAAQPEG